MYRQFLNAFYIYLTLTLTVNGTINGIQFKILQNFRLSTRNQEFPAISSIKCAENCLATGKCNGFGYNKISRICEIHQIKESVTTSFSAAGWLLYLPEQCLEENGEVFYSIAVADSPITSTFCANSTWTNKTELFVKLSTGEENNFADASWYIASSLAYRYLNNFSSYGIDNMVEYVRLRKSDSTFASTALYSDSPANPNGEFTDLERSAGYLRDCNSGRTVATLKMNIAGTGFQWRTLPTNRFEGTVIGIYTNAQNDTAVHVIFGGHCGWVFVENYEDELHLIPVH